MISIFQSALAAIERVKPLRIIATFAEKKPGHTADKFPSCQQMVQQKFCQASKAGRREDSTAPLICAAFAGMREILLQQFAHVMDFLLLEFFYQQVSNLELHF